jgi:hypothetical protein
MSGRRSGSGRRHLRRSRGFSARVEGLEGRRLPATFTVTSVGDLEDLGDPVPGSFRAAILAANANPGADTIDFRIDPGGARTILPGAPLPEITEAVAIDATTQPGFDRANPAPLVTLDGTDAGFDASGLVLTETAGGSRVQGLAIVRFAGDAIRLTGGGGSRIVGNFLGTDTVASPDAGNFGTGVFITDSPGNTIGGAAPGERNVISGNGQFGVLIIGRGATRNRVLGNVIGTDPSGTRALANFDVGVAIADAPGNTIGGPQATDRNVISGNGGDGILITGAAAARNVVQGNFVGTDVSGTASLGNNSSFPLGAVHIQDAPDNLIGGTAPGAGNLISGNLLEGLVIIGAEATGNVVQGNLIGTGVGGLDAGSLLRLGNTGSGVVVTDAAGNLIGGESPGAGNVIAGNNGDGVQVSDGAGNRVVGNAIGTTFSTRVTGFPIPLGNLGHGVLLQATSNNNTVGGEAAGAGNVIANNGLDGVRVVGGAGNRVAGNIIGLDASGRVAQGNGLNGVAIETATATTVGGEAAGAGNVIANNALDGVRVVGGAGNRVAGNIIGLVASGRPLGNGGGGVVLDNASDNTVGGQAAGAGNVIAANGQDGLRITGAAATGNVVQGNLIGTGIGRPGDAALERRGNGLNGVLLEDASGNLIGGEAPGTGNVIAANLQNGVQVFGGAGNRVVGNAIGTTFATSGSGSDINLGNFGHGVFLLAASDTAIGGEAVGAGNIIAGNSLDGVMVLGGGDNRVAGNVIGLDASGRVARGNGGDGVALDNASGNTVGGQAGAGNVIAANGQDGLRITGAEATGNVVQGNLIGTDRAGRLDRGNASQGVAILAAPGNLIGGATAAARNVIAGNGQNGVAIVGPAATGNSVRGNFIGVAADGASDLGNDQGGVAIVDAAGNTIGGTAAAERNVIAGNGGDGIRISGAGAAGNLARGNFIGVAADGASDLGNDQGGVAIAAGTDNVIGGTEPGAGNVIAGNGTSGVSITVGATRNRLEGNVIGLDVTASQDVGNTGNGVIVDASAGNTIGGTAAGARNVISGNDAAGIALVNIDRAVFGVGNVVQGNFIGTDGTGLLDRGNGQYGIIATNAGGILIGGTTPGARNVIAGNSNSGVFLQQAISTGNVVQGNFIGVDALGTGDLGNSFIGVLIAEAPGNLIGGGEPGAGNVISGNDLIGVTVAGIGATGNVVQGNLIGTDASGTRGTTRDGAPIGNTQTGVFITGAPGNRIGGALPGQGNVIAGNLADGIQLFGPGSTGNVIAGNVIGADASVSVPLGNVRNGVLLLNAPGNLIGGAEAGARNLIAANGAAGVQVGGGGSSGNTIAGNFIGTDASGRRALGNALDGVFVLNATGNTIGGATTDAQRNVISGNGTFGIRIARDVGVALDGGNLVLGNFIGTNAPGTAAVGNAADGVQILNAPDTTIGGTTAGARNLIAGNGGAGIQVVGGGEARTVVQGNFLGTDGSGTGALPNGVGVFLSGTSSNRIGGTEPGARNLISGNASVGVQVFGVGAQGNRIEGNFIGTDVTGRAALGNRYGVFINGVSAPNNRVAGNLVGGTAPGAGNVISGNDVAGVFLFGPDVTGNAVQGNFIGTDATGSRPLLVPGATDDAGARQDLGVLVNAAPGNTIGGTVPGARNVLSGNLVGVSIISDVPAGSVPAGASVGTTVVGNFVGTDASGTTAASNQVGVFLNGASANTIGGTAPGAGNLISGNDVAGVYLLGPLARGNLVQGNFIGTDASGRTRLPNRIGVFVSAAPGNTIGGATAAARNVISGNASVGVYLFDGAAGNVVRRNLIGTAADGRRRLGNVEYGVLLFNAPNNAVARRGPDRNIIQASGIGNFREFTGPVAGQRRRRPGRRIPNP